MGVVYLIDWAWSGYVLITTPVVVVPFVIPNEDVKRAWIGMSLDEPVETPSERGIQIGSLIGILIT
jgi:hypothetical protein